MEGNMKKHLIAFTVLSIFTAMLAFGQTSQEYIQMGDEAYAQFDDQKALEYYEKALEVESDNYEALWKTSRAIVDIADLLKPKDKKGKAEQKEMYTKATSYARRAVAINPDDTWGYFSVSAAIGKKVLLEGKKQQIDASKEVKTLIDKAIELDPTNDLAWHALGRWHRRLDEIGGAQRLFGSIIYGSIPKGTFEESEQALEKAVELQPDLIVHHLELGRTYVSLKKFDAAAGAFQKCLDLPKSSSKDDMYKEEAQTELDKVNKKRK